MDLVDSQLESYVKFRSTFTSFYSISILSSIGILFFSTFYIIHVISNLLGYELIWKLDTTTIYGDFLATIIVGILGIGFGASVLYVIKTEVYPRAQEYDEKMQEPIELKKKIGIETTFIKGNTAVERFLNIIKIFDIRLIQPVEKNMIIKKKDHVLKDIQASFRVIGTGTSVYVGGILVVCLGLILIGLSGNIERLIGLYSTSYIVIIIPILVAVLLMIIDTREFIYRIVKWSKILFSLLAFLLLISIIIGLFSGQLLGAIGGIIIILAGSIIPIQIMFKRNKNISKKEYGVEIGPVNIDLLLRTKAYYAKLGQSNDMKNIIIIYRKEAKVEATEVKQLTKSFKYLLQEKLGHNLESEETDIWIISKKGFKFEAIDFVEKRSNWIQLGNRKSRVTGKYPITQLNLIRENDDQTFTVISMPKLEDLRKNRLT